MALDDYLAEEIALDCAAGIFGRREALRRLMLLGLAAPAAGALLAACGSDDNADDTAATTLPAGGASTSPGVTSPETTAEGLPSASSAPVDTASLDPTTTPAETTTTAAPTTTAEPTTTADTTPAAPFEGEITFTTPRGELIGELASIPDPKGAVLVIHENRGLTEHIRSIPKRLAAEGYTALAIDLLSAEGGTAALPTEADATAALGNAPAGRLIRDMRAGLTELERRAPGAKLAVIGFCFGGGMTWQLLADGETRLSAAVPFYGPAPADADFSGSPDAAVLGVYAELDARVNATQEPARVALEAAGLTHQILVLPGVDHAFFNDTGARYNADAAAVAYAAMLAWFGEHLA